MKDLAKAMPIVSIGIQIGNTHHRGVFCIKNGETYYDFEGTRTHFHKSQITSEADVIESVFLRIRHAETIQHIEQYRIQNAHLCQ